MEVLNKKWERVYRWLLAYIDENKFSGNLKLPSENALCRDLKVSRDTVRAAMDQLERESLIRRVQGSGTYFNRDVAMSRELDSGRAKVKIGMILQGQDGDAESPMIRWICVCFSPTTSFPTSAAAFRPWCTSISRASSWTG